MNFRNACAASAVLLTIAVSAPASADTWLVKGTNQQALKYRLLHLCHGRSQ